MCGFWDASFGNACIGFHGVSNVSINSKEITDSKSHSDIPEYNKINVRLDSIEIG